MSLLELYESFPPLSRSVLMRITQRGVRWWTLESTGDLRIAYGFILACGHFKKCSQGRVHVVVPVWDHRGHLLDLTYLSLETNNITTELNEAFALGEEQIGVPWHVVKKPLWVHPTVREWIDNQCKGIVILQTLLAPFRLSDETGLVVKDPRFGKYVEKIIQPRRPPKILVSIEGETE